VQPGYVVSYAGAYERFFLFDNRGPVDENASPRRPGLAQLFYAMISRRISGLLAALACIAACGDPQPGDEPAGTTPEPGVMTAATVGAQVVLPTSDYLKLPEYQNADREYGTRLAMQCRACHSFEPGGPSISGPNLYGLFGRGVGKVDGYPYSTALDEADFIWTPEALDAWLEQPTRFLPGNRMAYPGLREKGDRQAVIAEILRLTDDSVPRGNQ
jgi:cytochrome c